VPFQCAASAREHPKGCRYSARLPLANTPRGAVTVRGFRSRTPQGVPFQCAASAREHSKGCRRSARLPLANIPSGAVTVRGFRSRTSQVVPLQCAASAREHPKGCRFSARLPLANIPSGAVTERIVTFSAGCQARFAAASCSFCQVPDTVSGASAGPFCRLTRDFSPAH